MDMVPLSTVAAHSTAAAATLMSPLAIAGSSEKRIISREAGDPGFIALMTCDGSSESARHAEPDEAQIPSLSSRINRDSDSMPWKVMLAVFASRCVLWPFNSVSGIELKIPSSSSSRSGRTFFS